MHTGHGFAPARGNPVDHPRWAFPWRSRGRLLEHTCSTHPERTEVAVSIRGGTDGGGDALRRLPGDEAALAADLEAARAAAAARVEEARRDAEALLAAARREAEREAGRIADAAGAAQDRALAAARAAAEQEEAALGLRAARNAPAALALALAEVLGEGP